MSVATRADSERLPWESRTNPGRASWLGVSRWRSAVEGWQGLSRVARRLGRGSTSLHFAVSGEEKGSSSGAVTSRLGETFTGPVIIRVAVSGPCPSHAGRSAGPTRIARLAGRISPLCAFSPGMSIYHNVEVVKAHPDSTGAREVVKP